MKPAAALALAAVGGVIALRCLPRESRERLTSMAERQMLKGMEHMMASLPEGSPPKLVISILPKLKEQNDQIIAMLRELNELLQERRRRSPRRLSAQHKST